MCIVTGTAGSVYRCMGRGRGNRWFSSGSVVAVNRPRRLTGDIYRSSLASLFVLIQGLP
jgi:hypothetical protein